MAIKTKFHYVRTPLVIMLSGNILLAFLMSNKGPMSSLLFLILGLPALFCMWLMLKRGAYLCVLLLGLNITVFGFYLWLIGVNLAPTSFNSILRYEVFIEPVLRKAGWSLLAFNSTMALCMLGFSSGIHPWKMDTFSRLDLACVRFFWKPALAAAFIMAAITTRAPLITQHAYHSAEYTEKLQIGGQTLKLLWTFLLNFSVIGTLWIYGTKHRYFRFSFFIITFMIMFFVLLRGNRGLVAGFYILLSCIFFIKSTHRHKYALVAFLSIFAFISLQLWGLIRWESATIGMREATIKSIRNFDSTLEQYGPTAVTRLPAVSWNLFDCIQLYEEGIRRNGKTYVNLILQAVPEAVADMIGFQRPTPEPWILARYVTHGGAIYPIAEAYWNFGLIGIILFASAISAISIWFEKLFRKLPPSFAYIYFGGLTTWVGGFFASTQAFFRLIEAMILLLLVTKLLRKIAERYTFYTPFGLRPHCKFHYNNIGVTTALDNTRKRTIEFF